MSRIKENKGFTMVEIIIVMAVLALLSGITIRTVSYIHYGNSKKCVAEIDSMLDKLQVEAMSKEETPYLYLYGNKEGYFMVISTSKDLDRSGLESLEGTKIAGTPLKIKVTNGTEIKYLSAAGDNPESADTVDFARFGFKKSTGAFLSDSFWDTIEVEGSSRAVIHLVESTGKHYVE